MEDDLYYCRHCGCKTNEPYWPDYLNYRCPKCGASTQPVKW